MNGEAVGFVDLGNGVTSQTEASQALVFMLVNINGNFKIPIAYYLIASLMAQEKVTILSEILRYLHQNEIDVRSVTFDGAPANITMCEKLGACLRHDRKNIKSYFEHPCTQKPVYIFYDPCHMLKLVRNNFAKSGIICDGEGNFVNWNFIVTLIRLIEFEGLHPAVKIRRRHIHFHNEKMKVNLAAQVLSNSVGDALLHAEVDRKLIRTDSEFNFKGASATAKFCKTFNDIFDLLNSRNLYNKSESKCAITKTNISILKSKVENYIKYIANLKINDVPILQTNVRTGFIGFIICLQNVITLAEQLLSEDKINFLLTYKLSQDHVETFFALIRRMGGWNNNPSVRISTASYRKILQLAKVSVPLSANCVPKDDTTLLSLSENYSEAGDKCIKNDNIDADNDLFQIVLLDHDYFTSVNYNPSEYARDIIKYVAGFVVRSIERKLSCQTCCNKLRNKNTYSEDVSKLLLRKNRMTHVDLQNGRGLIEASSDVVNM